MRVLMVFLFCSLASGSLVASNVTAYVSGGTLYLFGDSGDNSVSVDSPGSGQIRVSGMNSAMGESTSINGTANDTVVLNGWTGGIYAYLYAGKDELGIRNLVVHGWTHVDLGPGNDQLLVGPERVEALATIATSGVGQASTILNSGLYVLGADGDDRIRITHASILGRVTLDSGNGADVIETGTGFYEMTEVEVKNTLAIYPGNGLDRVFVSNTFVRDDLFVDDTIDSIYLDLVDVEVGRNAFIYGTPSVDVVNLDNVSVSGILDVFTEGGSDSVYISGAANRLTLILGSENDNAMLENFDTKSSHIALDGGDDSLAVNNCEIGNSNCFGSSGNDNFDFQMTIGSTVNIYGDGGTDTLFQMANSFGQLNTYSVENQ